MTVISHASDRDLPQGSTLMGPKFQPAGLLLVLSGTNPSGHPSPEIAPYCTTSWSSQAMPGIDVRLSPLPGHQCSAYLPASQRQTQVRDCCLNPLPPVPSVLSLHYCIKLASLAWTKTSGPSMAAAIPSYNHESLPKQISKLHLWRPTTIVRRNKTKPEAAKQL